MEKEAGKLQIGIKPGNGFPHLPVYIHGFRWKTLLFAGAFVERTGINTVAGTCSGQAPETHLQDIPVNPQ